MTLNRQTVSALQANLEYQLGEIKIAGYKVVMGRGKYDPYAGTMEFKVHLNPIAANGEVVDQRTSDFKRDCERYGLEPEDLGKTFSSQGHTFKITGLNARAHKMPICASRVPDGKKFKFSTQTVLAGLGKKVDRYGFAVNPFSVGDVLKNNLNENGQVNLKGFVNGVKKILNQGAKRPDADIIKDLRMVENDLSPENLCCDGEASASYVRQRSAELHKRKAELTKELGREASPRELWAE